MTDASVSADERLIRNLHPDDFDNGRINSSAFNPSPSHHFKLSVDRSSISSPVQCYDLFTNKGFKSVGVCGVLCADFSTEALPVGPDPLDDNPAHALVDYTSHSNNQRRKKGRRLADKALQYGLDHEP